MKQARKIYFTALGDILEVDGKHRYVPRSPAHFTHELSKMPLGVCAATFEKYKATRSEQQLHYHWVLMGYLAEHTGYTKEELHDAIMRLKFGTKTVTLGDLTVEVRKSVSDRALFPKSDMVELLTYDLELCEQLGVRVPTREELGYISNT